MGGKREREKGGGKRDEGRGEEKWERGGGGGNRRGEREEKWKGRCARVGKGRRETNGRG